ncbi:26063_t:CDS:2 [Dentiscutata erythropus]|uniref:26063_t:CDS:1 n=1 Tax=Dentiscutata erythropus TaxID=1348616 RepID=A0A9N9HKV4_9GLOM|nr:26063_t:CDS:2 [Dentiscutata erythropus]
MKPKQLQFIKTHGYLSHNRSGTQLATTNNNDYIKSPYYVEIAMYLYLVLPHEYSQIIHNEPNNMYLPQWMTKKQMDHEIWTPSIQYFKEEIFENIYQITNNRIKEQFPNQEIFEEYKTLYDSDKQNNSAEKPNYL